jgi:hypothetical protein
MLVTLLKRKLAEFVVQNFEAKWQDNMFKKCLENLTIEQIVLVVDYVENYSFQWQNEVQSQHWFNFQVTTLVHLTFRVRADWDGNPNSEIVTKYHFYISDDKQHDNLFMQHCFGLHKEFLQTQGQPLPIEHILFSDGCSS